MSNWHKRLKSARLKSGLTIAQATARIQKAGYKVGKRTVEHWEAGERTPPAEANAVTRERVLAAIALPNVAVRDAASND